jgi:Heavy-metal-associated domain
MNTDEPAAKRLKPDTSGAPTAPTAAAGLSSGAVSTPSCCGSSSASSGSSAAASSSSSSSSSSIYSSVPSAGALYVSLAVSGMMCMEGCGQTVMTCLQKLKGVISASVHFPTRTASVQVSSCTHSYTTRSMLYTLF